MARLELPSNMTSERTANNRLQFRKISKQILINKKAGSNHISSLLLSAAPARRSAVMARRPKKIHKKTKEFHCGASTTKVSLRAQKIHRNMMPMVAHFRRRSNCLCKTNENQLRGNCLLLSASNKAKSKRSLEEASRANLSRLTHFHWISGKGSSDDGLLTNRSRRIKPNQQWNCLLRAPIVQSRKVPEKPWPHEDSDE